MSYNIIGDIHGRDSWKKLVRQDCTNIFVGDYFAPYDDISFEKQKENFLDIIDFVKRYPNTVLLIGSHDEDHWHPKNGLCSRHDFVNEKEIRELFESHKEYFKICFASQNCLFTHAGVSIQWFIRWTFKDKYFFAGENCIDLSYIEGANTFDEALSIYKKSVGDWYKTDEFTNIAFWNNKWYVCWEDKKWRPYKKTPKECESIINNIWKHDPKAFSFGSNADCGDYCGTSPTQSPIWIRYEGLNRTNIFRGSNYFQIYGHTISRDIQYYIDKDSTGPVSSMIMVDCLQHKNKSLVFHDSSLKIEENEGL